jgi:hypothetical protein
MNLKLLADDIISSVKEYIEKALSPLDNRLKQLEARPAPEKGEKGADGRDGIDGKDGRDGIGFAGQDGAPGRDGADGLHGKDGRDGIDGKDGRDGIGFAGQDGAPGRDGADGLHGKDGRDGIDGKSVTVEQVREMFMDMYQVHQAQWALDFERRAQDILQRSIDRIERPRDGKDGKDGRDGLGVEDFTLSIDGRDVTATIKRGDFVKSHTVRIPALLDRGVFKEIADYQQGDGVTWGGSFWIAQKDAPEGKPGSGPDWRLAVKAGRDAR